MSRPARSAHPSLDEAVAGVARRSGPAVALLALARALDEQAPVRPAGPATFPRLEGAAGARSLDAVSTVADALTQLGAGDPAAAGPGLLGRTYERLLGREHRRRRGVWYTPPAVAAGLVGEVLRRFVADLEPDAGAAAGPARSAPGPGPLVDERGRPTTVCDPALGGGAFLLAAADALAAGGVAPAEVVGERLWGIDVDPLAVAVTEAALVLWARARGHDADVPGLRVADTLLEGADGWPAAPPGGFAAVVGNPPFQSQLGARTARPAAVTEALRDRWGPAVFRYTDTAALFLLASLGLVAPGGRVAMIVPVPVLVTDDAARVRRAVEDDAVVEHLWIGGDDVFDAGVRVCAPVLRRRAGGPAGPGSGGARPPVTRSEGVDFRPRPPRDLPSADRRSAPRWGALVADGTGAPDVTGLATAGRLGDLAEATAGFRDQFYGIAPFVAEAEAEAVAEAAAGDRPDGAGPTVAKLVTSGLVDPARCRWGQRATRFAGTRWEAPVVDLVALGAGDPSLAAWARARLVPKVVVATQTRVIEAAVDLDGDWFPSVPTVAVTCPPERLWDVASVVLAPAVSAWAFHRHAGAALSADALKVSARQLLEAPLPAGRAAWTEAATHLRAASAAPTEEAWRLALTRFGAAMGRAYAAPDTVLAWWLDRLPRWR